MEIGDHVGKVCVCDSYYCNYSQKIVKMALDEDMLIIQKLDSILGFKK